MTAADDLIPKILALEPRLRAWIRSHAASLLRTEGEDDLAQEILTKATQARASFLGQHEGSLLAWLTAIAERHVCDRADWWSALRRASDQVVRLSHSDAGVARDLGSLFMPEAQTGPLTASVREEMVARLARALAALPERDRTLALWFAEARPLGDQADSLGLSYEAAKKASSRALDRLAKVFRLLPAS